MVVLYPITCVYKVVPCRGTQAVCMVIPLLTYVLSFLTVYAVEQVFQFLAVRPQVYYVQFSLDKYSQVASIKLNLH